MISDTERREVAQRLREVEGYAIPDRRVADHPITGEVIAAAVMYDLPDVKGLLDRLADLIEPSCDRDALMALAEDVDEAAAMAVVMDGSEGTKLLAELLLDIAHRIREALGVSQ